MRRLAIVCFMLIVVSSFEGCASFGTHTEVSAPDVVSHLNTVSIWPIRVIPVVGEVGEKYPELAEFALQSSEGMNADATSLGLSSEQMLYDELQATEMFQLFCADSVRSVLAKAGKSNGTWPKFDWAGNGTVLTSDAVIVAGVGFRGESGGVNSYVTLSMYEVASQKLVAISKFNTKWGKSYFLPKPAKETLPDAIQGAVNGLRNALKSYRASPGSK